MSRFRRHARFVASALVAAVVLTEDVRVSHAALTTPSCLALKRKAWSDLRKCQAAAEVKTLKGKVGDPVKCQTQFDTKLAKIDAKATKAAIPCQFGDNGDGTVIDYDSGLQWEKKLGGPGIVCPIGNLRCVTKTFTWDETHAFVSALNGTSAIGLTLENPFAGFSDWRLPTIFELADIRSPGQPAPPLIDPIFGGTSADAYWSGTALTDDSSAAWSASFLFGGLLGGSKATPRYVRVVRRAL